MDFDAARLAFESFIDASLTTVPTAYENVPDSDDLKTAKTNTTDWARVVIKQGTGFATEIGPHGNSRWPGIVIVSLFVPLSKGTKTVRDRATTIADAVKAHSFTNILVRTPSLAILGKDKQSPNWCQANLTIPFELNQIT